MLLKDVETMSFKEATKFHNLPCRQLRIYVVSTRSD